MTRQVIIAVFLVWVLASCSEDEVVPRTNPRFSVAFVQTVDASGVEFAANMYDFGSDEILEHGFVFGSAGPLTVETSEIVRSDGSPASEFRLKATYGMNVGDQMIVSAFIRTDSGVVYSEPFSFTSQGSEGFVFERYEVPEQVYFGDTIRVYAKSLPRSLNQYAVRMQGQSATISKVGEGYFEFLIPGHLTFEENGNVVDVFSTDLQIAGKSLHLEVPLKFRDAEFVVGEIQDVHYGEEVTISGKFLFSDRVEVRLRKEVNSGWEVPLVSYSDQEIVIAARFNNYIYDGDLFVKVRGKEYALPDIYRMKGSELLPNQTYSGLTNQYYEVKGEHFVAEYQSNSFETDIPGVTVNSEYAFSNESGINFGGIIVSRNLKVYANNYGQKSQNYAEFHFTDPNLRHMEIPDEFAAYRFVQESGVTVDGMGYFFLERNVYKLDPGTRKVEKVAVAPESIFNLAGGFSYYANNGKIYLGAISSSPSQNSFLEFDPRTNKLKQLANTPSLANKPKLVYSTEAHLYYEGGYKFAAGGYIWDPGVYKYTIATNKWEKLLREFDNDEYTQLFRTFRYDGQLYSILRNTGSIFPEIKRFNPTTETWEDFADLGHYGGITSANEIFVVGDWVYSFYPEEVSAYNMKTRATKIWQHGFSVSSFNWNYSFQANGKIYVTKDRFLYEFDPEYFDQ